MRSPWERASLMISRIWFSASPPSFAGGCFCLAVMISMSSDFVIALNSVALSGPDVLLEQVAQARARGTARLGAVAREGLGFLVRFLGLDRERDRARLAVDAGELRLDFLAPLEHRAGIFHPVAAELGGPQLPLDAVAKIDDRTAGVDFLDHTAHEGSL